MSARTITCPHCGRPHNPRTRYTICYDCRRVARIRKPGPADKLEGGQWVNDRGIQRWQPTPRPQGRPVIPDPDDWAEGELKTAHRRYAAGDRDAWASEGHRIYMRLAKRRQRAYQRAHQQRAA